MSVSNYEKQRYDEVQQKETERRWAEYMSMKLDGEKKLEFLEHANKVEVNCWSWCPNSGRLQVEIEGDHCGKVRKRTQFANPADVAGESKEIECRISERSRKTRNIFKAQSEVAEVFKSFGSAGGDLQKYKDDDIGRVRQKSHLEAESSLPLAEGTEADCIRVELPEFLEVTKESLQQHFKRTQVLTRSAAAAMRRVVNSESVGQGMRIPRTGKKVPESFVPWKKPAALDREGVRSSVQPSDSIGKGKKKDIPKSGKSLSPQSPSVTVSLPLSGAREVGNGTGRSATRLGRLFPLSTHAGDTGGKTNIGRPEGGRGGLRKRDFHDLSPGIGSSSEMKSTKSRPVVQDEVFSRNRKRRFSVLQVVQGSEGQLVDGKSKSSSASVMQACGQSSSATNGIIGGEEGPQKYGTPRIVQEEQEALDDNDEDYAEEGPINSEGQMQPRTHALAFYEEDNEHDIGQSENEGDVDAADVLEEACEGYSDDDRDVTDLLHRTDAERKKERRQERATLEKQGERRRQEGLPRNYLLVDEKTQKPYNVGVGDWRKELMLLSRDLDPAIGNINQQPEGAVAEIADWIQRTWEYSSPVKFEYVKEVIARGVTLRRAELWKKIRNGEPKPTGMSDRTWRTLERQLDNPASIRKSENCRRANASRVNFGRTGPSGEVGVRQRLRRILRRSPDPEEVRFEMARDKGYGGRHVRENSKSNVNIMHGSGGGRRLIKDKAEYGTTSENLEEDGGNEDDDEEAVGGRTHKQNVGKRACAGSGEMVLADSVASKSTEEICKHPFVLMMMQRLEALEGRRSDALAEGSPKSTEEFLGGRDKSESQGGENAPDDLQDVGRDEESEETELTPTSRRPIRKGRRESRVLLTK